MSATRSRSVTTRWPSCSPSPTREWTATAISRARGIWRRRFSLTLSLEGRVNKHPLIRTELELAAAVEERAGAHIELAVFAEEEQRALWHFLGALQQEGGVVGAHLVREGLAVLVVAIAHVGAEHPGRRRRSLGQGGRGRRAERERKQDGSRRNHRHGLILQQPVRKIEMASPPWLFAKPA